MTSGFGIPLTANLKLHGKLATQKSLVLINIAERLTVFL